MVSNYSSDKFAVNIHYAIYSHCIFTSPFAGVSIVLRLVGLKQLCDLRDEGVVGICISEKRANGQEDLGNGQSRGPLVFQNVEADAPVRMDVAMVNSCRECHFGWLEGIVGGEVDVEEEDPTSVRRVIGAHDRCLPSELVFLVEGASRAVSRRVLS